MTVWRLAERLRIAVIGLPLALWGCEKEPRHAEPRAIVVVDAARPAPEVDAAEPDAALDAGGPKLPASRVKPPALRRCGAGSWCAPPGQAAESASSRAKDFEGCATALGMRRQGEFFALTVDRSRTRQKRAAGQDLCCYDWSSPCPVIKGRALLDRGAAVMARLRGRRPGDARARTWAERGLGEHASVAAFARATLELLAVGAPPALVQATMRAAGDEIAHARGCFAMAERYAGAPVEPAALRALPARADGLAGVARDTFLEGCVHETLAVPMAMGWQQDAPAAERPLLRRIVREETQHAELAWQTVVWAVAAGGSDARDALADAAREGRRQYGKSAGWSALIEPTLALI